MGRALSEGGNGLEEFLPRNFHRPDLVVLLDFGHAAGYLEERARAWHPKDAAPRAARAQAWCPTRKPRGGTALRAERRGLAWPRGQPAVRDRDGRHASVERYRANGWESGAGPVASACKTVVGQRRKLAGMRWREPGTDAVCHLRALSKSERGQGDAFWHANPN